MHKHQTNNLIFNETDSNMCANESGGSFQLELKCGNLHFRPKIVKNFCVLFFNQKFSSERVRGSDSDERKFKAQLKALLVVCFFFAERENCKSVGERESKRSERI